MIGAFFDELIYLNRLDALKECQLDTMEIARSIGPIVDEIKSGNEAAAFQKGVEAAITMSNAVKACKAAPAEAKLLGEWFITKCGSKDAVVEATTS